MAIASGNKAVINGIPSLVDWDFSIVETRNTFVNSATLGGSRNSGGVKSWSGSINASGAIPTLFPGQQFAFVGQGTPGADPDYNQLSGNAVIQSMTVNWNWVTNEIVNHSYSYSGSGPATWSEQSAITDATVDDNEGICGTKIEYSADGTAWTEIPGLTSASLNVTASNPTAVNSSTHSGGSCWTNVLPGGPINWTATLNQEDDTFPGISGAPGFSTDYWFRFYDTASTFWLLKFGTVTGYNGMKFDRNGAIVSRSIGLTMQAASGGSAGSITLPGAGSAIWP